MIHRRSCFFRLVSVSIYRRDHHHRLYSHHHCWLYLMAAAPSTFSVGRKDLFPFLSIQKSSFSSASSAIDLNLHSSGGGFGGGRSVCLRLKGCGSSENINKKNDKNAGFSNAGDGGGGGGGFWLHKARAIAPSLQQHLFRELVSKDIKFRLENAFDGHGDDGGRCRNDREGSVEFPEDQHLPPEKIAVAVDVDEVLGSFVSALNRFVADRYSSNHSVSEYHVYEFCKIWNCSRDEADTRVHEFFKTSYFRTGIHPIPGARQALQNLSRFCDLSIVTSRQIAIKEHTIEWIENHYPGLFQEIHFGNHFALDGKSRPKSEICRTLGAKVLIDDNPRYAIECAEVGIKVLLFDYENSYPWCKTESVNQHPLVTKVYNWQEVEHHLVSLVKS
ncbi:uncharacterized protein [Coffea arabica]|uniref:Uncharacterized protein isoform X1 n=1 Tax=Coffea arabica TaxID=13443 RepID=A0A6P6T1J6_COFAR|nr:uncharacterized protein LOC113696998 [Coffea arabica]